MKNGWYCLTVVWKSGEIQSVWTKSEKIALAIRVDLMQNPEIQKVYYYREEKVDHERP